MGSRLRGTRCSGLVVIGASLLGLLAAAPAASAATFSNSTPITVPKTGPAAPYPSTIAVTGLGTVLKVQVTLTGITHTAPDEIEVLLVGPTGLKTILWNGACGGIANPLTGQTFTFDDAAAATLSLTGPCPSGTYKPTSDPSDASIFPPRRPLDPTPWRSLR